MKKTIAIIEDDEALVQVYREALARKDIEIITAPTAQLALQLLTQHTPDLIILDIMLPGGMNGFDLLEQIKRNQKLSHTPVIMLTNLDGEEKVAKEIGVTDYIVKANTPLDTVVAKIVKYLSL